MILEIRKVRSKLHELSGMSENVFFARLLLVSFCVLVPHQTIQEEHSKHELTLDIFR